MNQITAFILFAVFTPSLALASNPWECVIKAQVEYDDHSKGIYFQRSDLKMTREEAVQDAENNFKHVQMFAQAGSTSSVHKDLRIPIRYSNPSAPECRQIKYYSSQK